jgi:hypothetical protein
MNPASESRPLRLIAGRGPTNQDWSVWLESEPQQACGGMTPMNAVRRWLELNETRFPGPFDVRRIQQESTLDRQVIFLNRKTTAEATCPECDGSGRYVGLHLVEDCAACGGAGVVPTKWSGRPPRSRGSVLHQLRR